MKKNYGVWGLGVVGKSVLQFLYTHSRECKVAKLSVMDTRAPSQEEAHFLQKLGVSYVSEQERERFFIENDVIIPSPGIDTRTVSAHRHKIIEELDLFFDAWKKPLIAVTGTVGKTSVVHLLSTIVQHNGITLATGGNIGRGMLDLVGKEADYALLELSSFQLEHAQRFSPDLALITNLYPNHLDRHGTMERYLKAKYTIMQHQKEHQKALVPWTLQNNLRALTSRPFHFFSPQPVTDHSSLQPDDVLYILSNQEVRKITQTTNKLIFNLATLPTLSYRENWLIILAACDILGVLNETFSIPHLELPSHRLEKVATVKGITFYNDSKSTIPESTLAAVEHLLPGRIHLFLGGLSKGVDRSPAIAALKGKVISIACFGKEAESLFTACSKAEIPAQKYGHLEEAFKSCIKQCKHGDSILFSPSGSSYDLFKDYKERGDSFVHLVQEFKKNV